MCILIKLNFKIFSRILNILISNLRKIINHIFNWENIILKNIKSNEIYFDLFILQEIKLMWKLYEMYN